MLRVVVDTNVVVSGILSRKGAPAELLDAWREHRFLLVTSVTIVAEVKSVLRYPRIQVKYHLSEAEINKVIILLEHDALVLPGEIHLAETPLADPKDQMFLVCALEGQADVIVSGDHHLLDLGAFQDTPILSARQFLDQFLTLNTHTPSRA